MMFEKSVNVDKWKIVSFTLKTQRLYYNLNTTTLKRCVLGVVMDEKLSFSNQINHYV